MPRTKSAESSTPAENSKKPATARPARKPQKQVTAKAKAPKSTALATKDQDKPAPPPGQARYRLVGPPLAPEVKSSGMMAASPVFNAMAVMGSLQKNLAGEKATGDSLMLAVDDQVARVQAGDMGEVEAMLMAQAVSLQTIYASLARRATNQEYLKQYQSYFTLALKAQAQSRATLEALIELKQPRHAPTFIKQANMANGPQQVNNGAAVNPDGSQAARPTGAEMQPPPGGHVQAQQLPQPGFAEHLGCPAMPPEGLATASAKGWRTAAHQGKS